MPNDAPLEPAHAAPAPPADRPGEDAGGGADAARATLASTPLFRDLPAPVLDDIAAATRRVALAGGGVLMRRGEAGDHLYVVVSGALGILRRGEDEASGRVAGVLGAGEIVGEMALISGEPRSATIVALRDCELLALDRAAFDEVTRRHPAIWRALTAAIVRRLSALMAGRVATPFEPRTVAVISAGGPELGTRLAAGLRAVLARRGVRVRALEPGDVAPGASAAFAEIERTHDLVLMSAHHGNSAWTRSALRQADRVLVVIPPGVGPADDLDFLGALRDAHPHAVEPVFRAGTSSGHVKAWLRALDPPLHHWQHNDGEDVTRLARHLTGHAVGLVLAGGGARGFAHLGVLRALIERGIPVDLVGGTSIGAIIGATIAAGWGYDEIVRRIKRSFVATNPLDDYTFPIASLMRGEKICRLLRQNFGDLDIEDLRLPFFCVSTDIGGAAPNIHRGGRVWRALRASAGIPGLVPPVRDGDGRLLVDGAIVNNFPTDLMAEFERGPVLGVSLGEASLSADAEPGLVATLMRVASLHGDIQHRGAQKHAHVLFAPEVGDIRLTAWKSYDRAVAAGYAQACSVLDGMDLRALRWGERAPGHGGVSGPAIER